VNETGTNLGCGANSLCTLIFNATDSLGNSNTTVNTTYTTDNVAPLNTTHFSAGSLSSSGATISATMGEAAKCTVVYGTNSSNLSGSATSSSFSTSVSVAITGLSASTTYYYNVTSCVDQAGNTNTFAPPHGIFNFTTSSSGNAGGGGGGSSGGSYTTSSTFEFSDITGSFRSVELGRGDAMRFSHEDQDHQVKVTSLGSTSADFEVMSEPQAFSLFIGQSKDVDVDGDTKADLNVKLLDIVSSKALVKVSSLLSQEGSIALLPPAKKVKEEPVEDVAKAVSDEAVSPDVLAPEAASAAPAPQQDAVQDDAAGGGYWYIFGALIAVVVVVLIVVIVVERKRKG